MDKVLSKTKLLVQKVTDTKLAMPTIALLLFFCESAFCSDRIYKVSPLIIIKGKVGYVLHHFANFLFHFSPQRFLGNPMVILQLNRILVRVYSDICRQYAESTFIFWFTVFMFCQSLLFVCFMDQTTINLTHIFYTKKVIFTYHH